MDTVKTDKGSTLMVAHRGLSSIEKENTAAAFIAAGNRSYWGIETDVLLTADGNFILIHDNTTQRVCSGEDLVVEETDYDTLRSLTVRDHDGIENKTYLRLPSVEEYFAICKKYRKKAVLEIKGKFPEEKLLELTERIKAFDYLEDTVFISFHFKNLEYLRKLLPAQKLQYLKSSWDEDLIDRLVKAKMDVDVEYRAVTPELVKQAHDNSIEVNCWTVNDTADVQKLIAMGVDYITTENHE